MTAKKATVKDIIDVLNMAAQEICYRYEVQFMDKKSEDYLKTVQHSPALRTISKLIETLETQGQPQGAKFVQIATAGSGETIDLFALDADGNVWEFNPHYWPKKGDQGAWMPKQRRRINGK